MCSHCKPVTSLYVLAPFLSREKRGIIPKGFYHLKGAQEALLEIIFFPDLSRLFHFLLK
jgi:hypothetical protein